MRACVGGWGREFTKVGGAVGGRFPLAGGVFSQHLRGFKFWLNFFN